LRRGPARSSPPPRHTAETLIELGRVVLAFRQLAFETRTAIAWNYLKALPASDLQRAPGRSAGMDADRLTYAYLVGSLLFVPVWLWLFVRNPAGRREMLIMSGLFVVTIGVPLELLLYSKDWWHPKTITGTALGIEDVIYSIGNGGYMAGLFGGLFPTLQ